MAPVGDRCGRALVGVSASGRHLFFALAFGASVGYERGTEHLTREKGWDGEVIESGGPVSRTYVGFETYLRFGTTFEL